MDFRDLEVAGPGVPAHGELLAQRVLDAGFRERDQRLHGHRLDDAHLVLGHFAPRGDRLAGHPVGSPGHLRAVMHAIANHDLSEPFAADGSGPARDHQSQRMAVHMRNIFAVHRPGD